MGRGDRGLNRGRVGGALGSLAVLFAKPDGRFMKAYLLGCGRPESAIADALRVVGWASIAWDWPSPGISAPVDALLVLSDAASMSDRYVSGNLTLFGGAAIATPGEEWAIPAPLPTSASASVAGDGLVSGISGVRPSLSAG